MRLLYCVVNDCRGSFISHSRRCALLFYRLNSHGNLKKKLALLSSINVSMRSTWNMKTNTKFSKFSLIPMSYANAISIIHRCSGILHCVRHNTATSHPTQCTVNYPFKLMNPVSCYAINHYSKYQCPQNLLFNSLKTTMERNWTNLWRMITSTANNLRDK